MALDNLGLVAFRKGEHERAAALHVESLTIARDLGDRHAVVISLTNLGGVAEAREDYGRAAALYEEGILLGREIGAQDEIAEILERLARVAATRGQPLYGVQFGAAAEALREALGVVLAPEQQPDRDRAVHVMREALGVEVFTAGWVEGRARPIDDVVAVVLEDRRGTMIEEGNR